MTKFIKKPRINVQLVTNANSVWARAVAASGDATTPTMLNPFWNRVLKFCSAPVMIEPPELNTKKPMMVLKVPVNTSVIDFFWANNPIIATKPKSTAGVLRKLIIKSMSVSPSLIFRLMRLRFFL